MITENYDVIRLQADHVTLQSWPWVCVLQVLDLSVRTRVHQSLFFLHSADIIGNDGQPTTRKQIKSNICTDFRTLQSAWKRVSICQKSPKFFTSFPGKCCSYWRPTTWFVVLRPTWKLALAPVRSSPCPGPVRGQSPPTTYETAPVGYVALEL